MVPGYAALALIFLALTFSDAQQVKKEVSETEAKSGAGVASEQSSSSFSSFSFSSDGKNVKTAHSSSQQKKKDGETVFTITTNTTCDGTNCTVCNNGTCISGLYSKVSEQIGQCLIAVCPATVDECEGILQDSEENGACPYCKCEGFKLIEPCEMDEHCQQGGTCDVELKACKYQNL